MLSIKPFKETGFTEDPVLTLKHGESTPFAALLRIVLLGHVPRKQLSFDLGAFKSKDSHIDYMTLLLQFKQLLPGSLTDSDSNKLSFYIENKTQTYIPFGTSNLLYDNKPIDLAKFGINDIRLGYINSGCFLSIRRVDISDSTEISPVHSFKWLEDGAVFEFRSADEKIVHKACQTIINTFKSYLGLNEFKNDEGGFGNLVMYEAFQDGYYVKCRRNFYTKLVFTEMSGDQALINDYINKCIKKYELLLSKL